MDKENVYYATGKRKSAIARTWIMPGNGEITVNDRPMDDYFTVEVVKAIVKQPLVLTNTLESFDVKARVIGGGFSGQAGAIRHGITKALILANPELRKALKKAGFVRRDARIKERKKYGQKGARARFQFSKR
ncbi:MAG: 30S ribosomal protein S9 [Deltaproteobacteria bacterium]|nr:30S ribosomal protein S9 [Deltaproteobacteria bacterium]OQY12213.1 MAG: 30S ribosomal protein S9 [Desulfobacteraceae bacterium 4572_187]MBW1958825.1 30S ribosomal protein S9 [Deltaproteobacteria bacterium]MBW2014333.1 30S ribosomal protein S9 [Deltaproteobacteria bacterium]MBW2089132.1 30S ribosomal protein S9 [Deltaproteobacteria bacterium]